jgi:hypothetical protein
MAEGSYLLEKEGESKVSTYWDDYDQVDREFESWWTGRAKEAPFISLDSQVELKYIDRIKDVARMFFHSGYEQKSREVSK